jgi:hypothetical protein
MSTRKIATALGVAALLIGAPASYAVAGQDGPGKPERSKECSDGVDNDGDGAADFGADADCGSANDNSEAADAPETVPNPNGTVRDLIGTVKNTLFPEEEPPGEEEPPAEEPPAEEPPAEDPLAPVIAVLDEAAGQLPPAPTQEELEAAVAGVVGQLPPPPAG